MMRFFSVAWRWIVVYCALFFLLLTTIYACQVAVDTGEDRVGTLSLSIVEERLGVQMIDSDIDMSPAAYSVEGVGPADGTFSVPTVEPGSDVVVDRLPIGDWSVTVRASNDRGTQIGIGTVTVTIVADRRTDASVLVAPIDGVGALELAFQWDDEAASGVPTVAVSVTDAAGGSTIEVPVQETDGRPVGVHATLPTGYYTVAVTLRDGDTVRCGGTVATRIVHGGASKGTCLFAALDDGPADRVRLSIVDESSDPLSVDITAAGTPVDAGGLAPVVVRAEVTNADFDPREASYRWSIDGAAVPGGEHGDSISLTPDYLASLKGDGGHGRRVFRVDVAVEYEGALSSASSDVVLVYPTDIPYNDGIEGGAVNAIAPDETSPGADNDLNGWSFRNIGDDPWTEGPATDGKGTKINWYFLGYATPSVTVAELETFWVRLVNHTADYIGGECWIQLYTHEEGAGDGGSWYRSTTRYYLWAEDFAVGQETVLSIGSRAPVAAELLTVDGGEHHVHRDIFSPDSGVGPYDDASFADQTVLAVALATNSGAEAGIIDLTVLSAGYRIAATEQREIVTLAKAD